jgi:hypothetical protein
VETGTGEPSRLPIRRVLAVAGMVAVGAIAALVIFSTGGDPSKGTPFAPIAKAAERTAEVSGARFAGTGTGTAGGLEMKMSFVGVYNTRSERSSTTMDFEVPSQPQLAEMMGPMTGLQDGLVMYMGSPMFERGIGKPWMKIDLGEFTSSEAESLGTEATDARGMLDQLRVVSSDARRVGSERVREALTTHYAATIDRELAAEQAREAGDELGAEVIESQDSEATVDVWIGKKDGLVHRMANTIPFNLVGGEGSELTMTTDFFDFGITPEIGLPPDNQVFDATELSKRSLEATLEGS